MIDSDTPLVDHIVAVVSDPNRTLFYTLSARNSISIYQPSGKKAVNHVQTMLNIYKLAQEKAPGAPLLLPLRTSRSLLYMYWTRMNRGQEFN